MEQDELYLSAKDAAEMLGVGMQTLYAYVSRKMLRSERIEGSRARRYWRADVERLSGKPVATVAPAAESELATESRITLITGNRLFFRGQDVLVLAREGTLESVAGLLWQVDPAAVFSAPAPPVPQFTAALRESLSSLGVLERAIALFPLVERSDPRAYDLSPAGYARTGADVLRWFAALVVGADGPASGPLHLFVARAMDAPPGFEEVIRQLLVLAADHEFDPITYAVRAVANVGVTPFQAVTAGLIASQGQRFRSERYGVVTRFMNEILNGGDGASAVVNRLRDGESLPGFHAPLSQQDPRTSVMMAALARALPDDPLLRRLQEAGRAAAEVAQCSMDFILPALFVGHRLGLHSDELAIASIGRMVGWVAHAMEQYHDHPLTRPRAKYVGLLPE
ncbi:MAG: citrate synthase [Pseudomonadota bacterium]